MLANAGARAPLDLQTQRSIGVQGLPQGQNRTGKCGEAGPSKGCGRWGVGEGQVAYWPRAALSGFTKQKKGPQNPRPGTQQATVCSLVTLITPNLQVRRAHGPALGITTLEPGPPRQHLLTPAGGLRTVLTAEWPGAAAALLWKESRGVWGSLPVTSSVMTFTARQFYAHSKNQVQ